MMSRGVLVLVTLNLVLTRCAVTGISVSGKPPNALANTNDDRKRDDNQHLQQKQDTDKESRKSDDDETPKKGDHVTFKEETTSPKDSTVSGSSHNSRGYTGYYESQSAPEYSFVGYEGGGHGGYYNEKGSGEAYGHGFPGHGYSHEPHSLEHHPHYYEHDHHDHGYHSDHGLALKGFLLPLAGLALLGAAAALVTNPILLQLGVVSGRRRRRATPEIKFTADDLRYLQIKPPSVSDLLLTNESELRSGDVVSNVAKNGFNRKFRSPRSKKELKDPKGDLGRDEFSHKMAYRYGRQNRENTATETNLAKY